MLSRYTPKLDDLKISNLSIDRVYLIYVHYEKFKAEPSYPDMNNPYLQDTKVFHAYVLTIDIPSSYGGLLGLAKCVWEKNRENMKSEGTNLEEK